MAVKIELASIDDVAELVALQNAVSQRLTKDFGRGFWSHLVSEKGITHGFKSAKVIVARSRGKIVGTLRLATKKPWAIDPAYFTDAKRPLYLIDMAVLPNQQRKGIGSRLMKAALKASWEWPADVVRLDAFDGPVGASEFYRKCGFQNKGHVVYRGTPLVYFELLRPT